MAKQKSFWYCRECGDKQSKWLGQCPKCSAWNSYEEELVVAGGRHMEPRSQAKAVRLSEVSSRELARVQTGVKEFDRLVGGGVVPGALSLVGGEPGIGKSTLLLQLARVFGKLGQTVLYISAEESVEQTSLRARRLGIETDNILLLSEGNMTAIAQQIDEHSPAVLVVDSIQLMYREELSSAPGSVSQVRECAAEFMRLAKQLQMTTFLVGHVTKSGEIAGPRVLEHLVDTVLYFEGDRQNNYRLLRVVKNRFGPTDEIAVFQMRSQGLVEIPNPSELFLQERVRGTIGSAIIPTMEGSRPILVETQALVSETSYSTPSRRFSGIDGTRAALLLAVLEKRAKIPFYNCDVFVSIAGGLKVAEPALDLGIMMALASSRSNSSLPSDMVAMGEVGLGGEVRSVPRIDTRLKEAVHMGFRKALIPKRSFSSVPEEIQKQIQIYPVEKVENAIEASQVQK